MPISRKILLKKIAACRKSIDIHLDDHIPEFINRADMGLVNYWQKEVGGLILRKEQWSHRLSKTETIVAEAVDYRRRLNELLDARIQQLND